MENYLVDTDPARDFLSLAASDRGTRTLFGALGVEYESQAETHLKNAQAALQEGARTVRAIARDETRASDVLKHEAAEIVAARVIEKLTTAKAAIEGRAEFLYSSGSSEASELFTPRLERAQLDSEIRGFIRETVHSSPEGILAVAALVKTNFSVAAAIYHSESFLLRISPSNLQDFRFEAVKSHVPTAHKKMVDSVALQELTPHFDNVIAGIKRSFYNPSIAARANTRVDV